MEELLKQDEGARNTQSPGYIHIEWVGGRLAGEFQAGESIRPVPTLRRLPLIYIHRYRWTLITAFYLIEKKRKKKKARNHVPSNILPRQVELIFHLWDQSCSLELDLFVPPLFPQKFESIMRPSSSLLIKSIYTRNEINIKWILVYLWRW